MIRLFSGDLTRVTSEPCPCGRTYRRLPEGIYGRVDDMLVVRGVNVYPHLIEDAIGSVPGVGSEYRIVVERPHELDALIVEVEAADPSLAARVREQRERDRWDHARRQGSSPEHAPDHGVQVDPRHRPQEAAAMNRTATGVQRLVDLSLEISNQMPAHAFFPSPIILPYVTHEMAKEAGPGRAGRPVDVRDQLHLDARARRHARRRAVPHRRAGRHDRRGAARLVHRQGCLPRPAPHPRPRRHRRRRPREGGDEVRRRDRRAHRAPVHRLSRAPLAEPRGRDEEPRHHVRRYATGSPTARASTASRALRRTRRGRRSSRIIGSAATAAWCTTNGSSTSRSSLGKGEFASHGYPLHWRRGTGSPVRAVAELAA